LGDLSRDADGLTRSRRITPENEEEEERERGRERERERERETAQREK